MLDSLNKEFIRTARSKGVPEWRVNFVHGLRVALIPIVVLIGFRLPMLIGGTVIIEQVFQWPGIGELFVFNVRSQNYPLVMMVAFLSVIAVLVASFLIDLFTALLDPRIKLE
jgi:peptide/nickel transport system permease protein